MCSSGSVVNRQTGESLFYQNLIETATKLEVPQSATLKEVEKFTLIGKSQSHYNNQEILDGSAKFGLDTTIEGMVHCSIVRCPVIGGRLIRFDDAKARIVDGYIKAIPIKGNEITTFPDHIRDGVAVIASSTWAAMKAAENIMVDWESGAFKDFNTEAYRSTLTELARKEGIEFRNEGQFTTKNSDSVQQLEAYYSGPYLSHSPMEPMNAIAHVTDTTCEVWIPCHNQSNALAGLKLITGLPDEAIQIHTTFIGGSFGRRLQVDYAMEAALVSKQLGLPVKVTWTRIEDTKYGVYRSGYVQKMKGVVQDGKIISFEQHIACASVWSQKEKEMLVGGLDYTVIMPAKILPYSTPHIRMTQSIVDFPIPICWWRASYPTIQHTVQECWFDELAIAAGRDPLELRLEMLRDAKKLKFAWQEGWGEDVIDQKRLANVLEIVKKKSGWAKKKKKGRGRGVACSVYGGSTYVAEVVEVTVRDNSVRVERVVCAVDCGRVLNPDNVIAQMEGGIIFGLSAALYGEISFTDGKVDQNSYQDYRIMTMRDTPEVHVEIVESNEAVGGVGEPGTHPAMAALCNAIFDATRKRVRDLPVRKYLN